jgi:hypothetical protein
VKNSNNYNKLLFIFKPSLLFFSALALNLILHELSHALAAYLLHVKSTMYQLYVNPDTEHATLAQNIIIAATGPFFSLCLGLVFWWAYQKQSSSSIKMFSLYGAVFGISIFLGNTFAASLGGDFHIVGLMINLPKTAGYVISVVGLVALSVFMFNMGKHFISFHLPFETTKATMILYMIIIPVFIGTALIILTYLPLTANSISNRITEIIFWIFTLIGAFRYKPKAHISKNNFSQINWFDIGVTTGTVILVRLLANGIDFTP